MSDAIAGIYFMLKRKIPVIYMFIIPLLCGVLSVVASEHLQKREAERAEAINTVLKTSEEECEYTVARLRGYKHIGPLYMAEQKCESQSFLSLKSHIDAFAQDMKTTGHLSEISVYLKDLNLGSWMEYNSEGAYKPGSLFKVVTMMAIFRMSEKEPMLLEKEIAYTSANNPPEQTFNSETITPGKKHKVKDLVRSMIVHSDNHATMLLHDVVDDRVFTSVFTDLGIRGPSIHDKGYTITVKEYSRFMSVLYDVGYLTLPASEVAVSLLSETAFNKGITKRLPKDVTVVHKFGEAGKQGNREFHESAIIYLSGRPYLLTIMTKGGDSEVLAEIIGEVSKITYDHMLATR